MLAPELDDNPGTTYLPDVPITAIFKHPSNPRHRAIADAEMVESVKTHGVLEPLILAPHPDKVDKYILIAGHRRLDALKKSKTKTAPALVRRDLRSEAQQLEAMLVENLHRENLTAIEEAEGYAQLELLGYKAQAIASAVGRDVKTVRSRLKLLKLSSTTRKKVHAGQLTIEDAAAFVEFVDDPEATKELETAAKGDNFKTQLRSIRRRRDARREAAKTLAKLLDAGATEIPLKKGLRFWSITDYQKGPVALTQTFSEDWGQHKGCLGVVLDEGDTWTDPKAIPVCTNPASHEDDKDAAERERQDEYERRLEENRAKERAAADASVVRVQSLLALVGTDTAMPAALRDLVRALIPTHIAELQQGRVLTAYQEALGIPEAARWSPVWRYETKPTPNSRKLNDHLEDVRQYRDGTLTRALVALLVATAEVNLRTVHGRREDLAGDYLDLLQEAGHPFSDADKELRDEISGTGDSESSEVDVA